MTMGVKVYYSEISGHKEVKKRQQRVMMILESKLIPYEAIDITEAGKEEAKDFMLKNAKPRGDSKYVLSPQIFNEEVYCGDYDDFDLANENDVLETFLNTPKVERKFSLNTTQVNNNSQNGGRESSAEAEALPSTTEESPITTITNGNLPETTEAQQPVVVSSNEPQTSPITDSTTTSPPPPVTTEQEVSSTTLDPPSAPPVNDDDEDLGVGEDLDEDEEGNSQIQK